MYKYDILLKNGTVVDPVNRVNGRFDVAVAGGCIAEVDTDLDPTVARECFDLKQKLVLPGIIDLHMHASEWLGGKFAHKMLAEAGVTTGLDMSGPVDGVLKTAAAHGVGLNMACIQFVRPEFTVKGPDPNTAELEALLEDSLTGGAIGFKILGGHYPLTAEATARTIEVAAKNGAYMAVHAGTLAEEAKSNIEGFKEAIELAQGRAVHMAHVNSYCRGLVRPCMEETEEALRLLEANPNICSEAYLAPINGTSAKCVNGAPESKVTGIWLERGGFTPNEQGMADAIEAGWAQINMPSGGKIVLATGQSALAYWRRQGTDTTVSFSVNPPMPRIRLATARRESGEFVIDSISTDGGGIPRNVIVSMGLSLVKLQALSIEEFVVKTSRNPARILGLKNKGHLGAGADADISVLNLKQQTPYMSVSNGRIIMYRGLVCGSGTRFVTTPAGEATVRAAGIEPLIVDPANTPFCQRV